jgi:ABC-type transporter MlaC component
MKFLITSFLFLFIIFNNNLLADQKSEINNIVNLIKINDVRAKASLIKTTLNLFDYEYFFQLSLPKIWSEASQIERKKIINFYNSHYVNKYFSDILSCKGLEFYLIERQNSIICSYTCLNSKDKKPNIIRFIKSSSKISDIQFRGISFLRNESDSLKNKYARRNKDEFMKNLY